MGSNTNKMVEVVVVVVGGGGVAGLGAPTISKILNLCLIGYDFVLSNGIEHQ